jgi:NADPH2:quinone reductase
MTMLAAVFDTTAETNSLALREIEIPQPGAGEVRVKVTVSGVNPTDWKSVRRGLPAGDGPAVPNQDGAGVIESVGDGVDPARVGQRVWVFFAAWQRRFGTAAPFCVVAADRAVPLPDGASDELGASLGIPALTAWQCLFADGPLDGATVLIAGGAGAVGHAAIELAHHHGARVLATASSDEKLELATAAGADAVVNYRDADAAEQLKALAPDGIDRFVEVSLARNLELDRGLAADHAVISAYADDGGGEVTVPIRPLMFANLALRFVLVYTMPRALLREAVVGVSAAVAADALTTLPLHRFTLTQIREAHAAVENGAVGKVLIDL